MLRIPVPADEVSGIREPSYLMVDKLTTVRRQNIDARVGRLSAEQLAQVERLLMVFLGFAR